MQAKLQSQLAATLSLYDQSKNPPFLVRNIEERLPADKIEKRPRAKFAKLHRDDFDLRAAVLLTEMNQRVQRWSPRLKVAVNDVGPRGRRSTHEQQERRVALRGRRDVIDVRCRLRLSIYNKRDTENSLYNTPRIARLHGQRQPDGRFELATTLTEREEPFEFQMNHLKDVVESNGIWREAMAEAYIIRFDITFPNPIEAKAVWDALGIDESASPQHGLWAKWESLPRCPTANSYLALFAAKDTTTNYALNVTMGWGTEEWMPGSGGVKRRRMSTPLECLNMLKRQKSNGQLPTPVSTPRSGSSITSTDITIRYHVGDRLIEKHGYRCLLCKAREQRSLDRLEFHLVQFHPGIEFKIDSDMTPGGAVDESFTDIIVLGNLDLNQRSKRPKGSMDKEDSVIDDFEWNAPSTPLSLQQVLRGSSARWNMCRKQKETSQLPQAPTFAPVSGVKLDLPVRAKRLAPLPRHPKAADGVAFLSSDNKAAMRTGEVFSDEDDGVDEAHLELARRVEMKEQIPDFKERHFLLDMNAYIESEGLHADKFLGPCLRRWLHKRKAWLKDGPTAEMFEQFLYAAWKRGYVSDELYKSCMDASKEIRNSPALPDQVPTPREPSRSRRGVDECICFKKVEGIKGRVICANKSCSHPEHHSRCVLNTPSFKGAHRLPRVWYCQTCLESVRVAFNESGSASLDSAQLPSSRDLRLQAQNPDTAYDTWGAILEDHGFSLSNA